MTKNYNQTCPVAKTLDIIGERWTPLIIRELITKGPRRYQDFINDLKGISPNTLSARLKKLEEKGIVDRKVYDAHPPRSEYRLTEMGQSTRPILKAMKEWGEKHL